MSMDPGRGTDAERAGRARFQRIERIFLEASALTGTAREAHLASACADDPSLHDEIAAMLAADGAPEGIIDRGALAGVIDLDRFTTALDDRSAPLPGRIGRCRIIRVLGRGGMGVVYEARQEDPDRPVALKVMNVRSAGARTLRRFRHEAQMLGRLQHPGIAQVFEAGIDDWGEGSQPYIVMELVRGEDLATHVRGRAISIEGRLSLLARLCDAVHHAHLHGVVHRDLKPANVLVVERGSEDGSGTGAVDDESNSAQPKVLDFGVARLLDPDGAGTTIQTDTGRTCMGQTYTGQLVGTVAYMSPEQAEGDPAAIDARTDIYALGVIAFELLGGRHPQDLHQRPFHDALRVLREQHAPRLGSIDRRLRGDVETIVAKALEHDRRERYPSAAEMGADLRRVLRHEPIQARPVGTVDQLLRLARRHRGVVAAMAMSALALIAATVISLRFAFVANSAQIEQARLSVVATERAEAAERSAYRATLVAAAASLRAHESAEAARLLDEVPVERRGWEWAHLSSRLDDSLLAVTVGVASPVRLGFGTDGAEVLLFTANGAVQRRRAEDLSLLQSVELPGNYLERGVRGVEPVAGEPSPGRGRSLRIAALSAVMELDPTTLEVIEHHSLRALGSASTVFAVDRTGQHVVRRITDPNRGASIELMRLSDGHVLHATPPVEGGGLAAAFSPDGRWVAWCHAMTDGLTVHRVETGERVFHQPDLALVHRLCFDRTGSCLAAGSGRGGIHLFEIFESGDGRAIGELDGHPTAVSALDISADGTRLASTGRDGTVRLWSLETMSLSAVMQGHRGTPNDLQFSPDGTKVFTLCSEDGTLRCWSAREAHDPFVLPAPGSVYAIDFASDRQRLASASLGGERPVRLWECAGFTEVGGFGDGAASAVAFDPSGDLLAVGRAHGPTTIFDARDGHARAEIPRHWWRTDWVHFIGKERTESSVPSSEGGATLLSLGNTGTVSAHDAESGAPVAGRRIGRNESTLGWRAAMTPDGQTVAVSAPEGILFLDAVTLEESFRIVDDGNPVRAMSFSPDGSTLALAGADRRIRIWDLEQRRVIATLDGHTAEIYALAFSPDGQRLASGGLDRLIRLWDTTELDGRAARAQAGEPDEDGQVHQVVEVRQVDQIDQLVQLRGHTSFIYCLAWHPDGHTLISGGGDATIRIWSTRRFAEVVAARE